MTYNVDLRIDDTLDVNFDVNENSNLNMEVGEQIVNGSNNYEELKNKPQINGVELVGNKSSDAFGILSYTHNTTIGWQARMGYIPKVNEICIYDDYKTIIKDGTEVFVKGIKIGDGKAYIVDLPFVTDDVEQALYAHLDDRTVHVNTGEREIWNDKLSCQGVLDETLIFNIGGL